MSINLFTFYKHPVEAGKMEEEGDHPAGAVDRVKYWNNINTYFYKYQLYNALEET